jgi:hypothetical protein
LDGPEIVARTISATSIPDQYGNAWQYHSRSDRHSKAACWAVAFDLLQRSSVLRRHIREAKVVLGVNHEMRDFQQNRAKNLDLVISRPANGSVGRRRSFAELAEEWEIVLTQTQRDALDRLPTAREAPVGAVLAALEAKATMTAHTKAAPRLHDELTSSHATVHGASSQALAVGFVMVNAAEEFLSPDSNKFDLSQHAPRVNRHKQPKDAEKVLNKVLDIPRRAGPGALGFDAVGAVVVDARNDGSPVKVVFDPPAPKQGDLLHYGQMIQRMVQGYEAAFGAI